MFFIFQKMIYTYDAEEKKQFVATQFPLDYSFKEYMLWKGYQEDIEIKIAERKYGRNRYGKTMIYTFVLVFFFYEENLVVFSF